MRKLVFVASVVALAASSVNCANSSQAASSLIGPSAVTADAKKPGAGHGDPGSLVLAMVVDANDDGAPNWGDTITFNVTTTAANPNVIVTCSQNGALVYSSFSWMYIKDMPLSSPSWTGGAASCSAVLGYDSSKGFVTLNTLDFNVGA